MLSIIISSATEEQLLLAAQDEALRQIRAESEAKDISEPKETPADNVPAEEGEEEAKEEDCTVDDKDVD